jgi:hypothetical protein
MLEFLLIVRLNNRMGLQRMLNFRLLNDVFPHQLARGIPLKDDVP